LLVCDLSHNNADVDLVAAKAWGIVGVILKVTEGVTWSDPTFEDRRVAAHGLGLLVGGYHFGNGNPAGGAAQAKHFLARMQPTPDELIALDFERNTPQMTLQEAADFTLACSPSMKGYWSSLATAVPANHILRQRGRWVPKYGPEPAEPHDLWQFSDGTLGPYAGHKVDGIGLCDLSVWKGTMLELENWWTGSKG